MSDLETIAAEIGQKVRKLMEENDRLRTMEARASQRCQELQEQVNNQNIIINNLNEENKFLKLGNALTQKGDSAEIKQKINQLIRSIDKTLANI